METRAYAWNSFSMCVLCFQPLLVSSPPPCLIRCLRQHQLTQVRGRELRHCRNCFSTARSPRFWTPAVTGQDDEFKAAFIARIHIRSKARIWQKKTTTKLSPDTYWYVIAMYLPQPKLCTGKTEPSFEVVIYLHIHEVQRSRRRTLTDESDVKYTFPQWRELLLSNSRIPNFPWYKTDRAISGYHSVYRQK